MWPPWTDPYTFSIIILDLIVSGSSHSELLSDPDLVMPPLSTRQYLAFPVQDNHS